ncbi:hypothetical protein BW723_02340 [Polaribacter reichenbachii]|uniref:Lipoprotein n=1 Tax=Polaribacter reichenbachii TaxID=996801 RepID=A0A1B8TVV5_9FLAO|nr:LptE family protein [Polaribacter reichenbachii]APZ45205.1 hypothetical protein BW723_02340 [Polaribacter reichenbachii]AUC19068.1 hypothetical protein BTO17_10345 [Polaribacter reichenbachii]OBY63777.1 hypothetical protein LPB301_13360 [Polaribacter reichenbachii]
MKKIILSLIIISALISCKTYSFTGGDIGNAKTIQIDFFPNQAPLVEPNLSQRFTNDLLKLFINQTRLTQSNSNGDLYFSGEITNYRITPISGTANQIAAQNRLTITINVRFTNKLENKKSFEKAFSYYSDFAANSQLTDNILDNALDEILERITQDIFNRSIANNF